MDGGDPNHRERSIGLKVRRDELVKKAADLHLLARVRTRRYKFAT